MVSRNARMCAEVTHVKIVVVTGVQSVPGERHDADRSGFVHHRGGRGRGLRFTPRPDSLATGAVTIRASIGARMRSGGVP